MRLDATLPFALLLSLVTLSGCQRGSGGTATPAEAADAEEAATTQAPDSEYDALVAGRSEDGDKVMEVRDYLDPKHDKNGLWKFDRDQTLKWADALYAAGAPKVYAVYSPADETIQVNLCAALLVELPAEKAERTETLRAATAVESEVWGPDAETYIDSGQKYLYLSLDP